MSKIVDERNPVYGDAWYWHGKLLEVIPTEHRPDARFLRTGLVGFYFPWMLILNKLLRALISPMNKDHWDDIIGYATLALQYLATKEAENESNKRLHSNRRDVSRNPDDGDFVT